MNNEEDCFHLGIKALIRSSKDKILLLKVNTARFNNPCDEHWDIPGGRIKKDDTIEQTLRREIEEETGITDISNIKHIQTVLSNMRIPAKPTDVGLMLAIYSCDIADQALITLSDEHTDSKWFDIQEAAKLLEFKYPKEFTQSLCNKTDLSLKNQYPKLVRDKIPEIIKDKEGIIVPTKILADDKEYLEYLQRKVKEEAIELSEAITEQDIAEETADVYEVIDSILALKNIHHDAVLSAQKAKRDKRGGFSKRILMLGK